MKPSATKEEMVQLLDETVQHYTNNPRAIDDNGGCMYIAANGCKCAVGRKLSDNDLDIIIAEDINGSGLYQLMNRSLGKELFNKYGLALMGNLQSLHDGESNWKDLFGKGLSNMGSNMVRKVKVNIHKGTYHKEENNEI